MLVCKFHDTLRVKSFFIRSTFSDLYQATYSTVSFTITSIMAQNDILRFSEEDLRGVCVHGSSLFVCHPCSC